MQATASARSADLFCDHLTLFLRQSPGQRLCEISRNLEALCGSDSIASIASIASQGCSKMQQALGATSYIIIPFFKLLTEVCRESFFQTFCTAGSGLQDPQLEACSCPISVEGCEGANMCQCVCSFVCLPACLSVCLFVYLILFDFICVSLYVVQRSYESYDIW